MSSKPTTAPLRPDMKHRASSTRSQSTSITSPPLSPTETLTQSTTSTSPPPTKEQPSFPFPFSRSTSKKPEPPIDLSIPASTTLKHVQSSPLPSSSRNDHPPPQRHRSDDGMIVSPSTSSAATSPSFSDSQKRGGLIQKKQRYGGSSPGGYGRHGDDWLFGGFSFTQTAKELVNRGRGRKEEERDSTRSH